MSAADNPFLALSFIAGPAILTNASAVLLNGASIRYNLAITLWRDLQSDPPATGGQTAGPYVDRRAALRLAGQRLRIILRGLNLLHLAVAGFGLSALTGLVGALEAETAPGRVVELAKLGTVIAAGFGLVSLLSATGVFIAESLVTQRLLRLTLQIEVRAQATPDRLSSP